MLPLLKNGKHGHCKSVVSTLAEVTLSYMHKWGVLQKTVIHLGSKAAVMAILLHLKIIQYVCYCSYMILENQK